MTRNFPRRAHGCAAAILLALPLTSCSPEAPGASEPAASNPAKPSPVNGWREYPLRDGVIAIQPFRWRTDSIDIPVPAGKDLEYKLEMKKGQGIVYAINYGDLAGSKLITSEFHGHTPKDAEGIGDLMFYSKTDGANENGTFTAPWDGIHGWYLNNRSDKDIVVKLDVAGFYTRTDQ
jgi:hypothetical protein